MCKQIFDYMFDEFRVDPYDKKYLIDYDGSQKHLLITNSHYSIFSENEEKNKNNFDMMFAVSHEHGNTMLCKIFIDSVFIHSFFILPNKIEWILNGTPIINKTVSIQFIDPKTFIQIPVIYRCFGANLNSDIRRSMYQDMTTCHFSNSSKYIQFFRKRSLFFENGIQIGKNFETTPDEYRYITFNYKYPLCPIPESTLK
jgi:hypothetical protein